MEWREVRRSALWWCIRIHKRNAAVDKNGENDTRIIVIQAVVTPNHCRRFFNFRIPQWLDVPHFDHERSTLVAAAAARLLLRIFLDCRRRRLLR